MKTLPALAALLLLMVVDLSAQELVWKDFRSARDGFSAEFPGAPQVVEEKDKADPNVVHRRYTVRLNGGGFNVSCTDFGEVIADRLVERLMANLRDGMVQGMKAKLLEDQPLKCDRYPGRRFAFSGPEGWISVKLCVAERVFCVAQATNSKGPWPAEVVTRFHGSFKLFPPTAQ
jgi:hypothetical protein